MDVIHFPDDPRPARWAQPVLALGNFDGLHRGHRKILERVQRVAGERGATLGRHDLRSASAARRPARQGAAAADDEGAEARGARRRPACRARRSCASRPSCRGGIPRRSCARCSSSGCTSPRCGSARTSCSATIAPATSRCCGRSARATASGPRRSIRSATRTSSSAARASGGWSARGAWTRPARCSATSTSSTASSSRATAAAARSDFRRRTLQTENELLPPHGVYATTATIDGVVRPSVTNIGVAADVRRRPGRATIETHVLRLRPRPVRRAAPRSGSCSACATSGRSSRSTRSRRRSPPTADRARALFDRLSL